jgi:hypothetical protein
VADPPFANTGFDPTFGNPLFKFLAAAKAQGIDANIISGVRTDQDQRELQANAVATRNGTALPYPERGRVPVAAPPGSSAHEFGLAADVEAANPGDQGRLIALGQQMGLAHPMSYDPTHFEAPNWRQVAANQPPGLPWNNVGNFPTQMASNVSASTPNAGGGFVAPGSSTTPVGLVANELIKRGVKPEVAAGAVAGLMGESGPTLDPTSFNTKDPGGGSGGIGQWNRTRLVGANGMLAFAANNGVSGLNVNNPQDSKKVPIGVQAQYLGQELDGPYNGVLQGLRGASSGQDGLKIWVNGYEGPKDAAGAIAQRTQYIQPVAAQLTGTSAAPVGTNINNTGAVGGGKLPGFGTQAASDQFTQGLQKMGLTQGQGQGQGGSSGGAGASADFEPPQPSPMVPGPNPQQFRNVAPAMAPAMAASLSGYTPQPYGQTLNSFSTPLDWGSAPPGSSPYFDRSVTGAPMSVAPANQPAGFAGTAGAPTSPQGTTINSLQQLQMLSNPAYQTMLSQGGY